MGYYAHAEQYDEFVVTDPSAVLNALAYAEKTENTGTGGNGHISWCHSVYTYRSTSALTHTDTAERDAHALCEMLRDFGFECEIRDQLIVTGWGGDKIGSSWDTVWSCLADGICSDAATPDTAVTWIMRGEDGVLWAEIIGPSGHTQGRVVPKFEVRPLHGDVIGSDMIVVGDNIFDQVR